MKVAPPKIDSPPPGPYVKPPPANASEFVGLAMLDPGAVTRSPTASPGPTRLIARFAPAAVAFVALLNHRL